MSNHNEATIDRDRAFDINSINELLTQGKSILAEAISISGKIIVGEFYLKGKDGECIA